MCVVHSCVVIYEIYIPTWETTTVSSVTHRMVPSHHVEGPRVQKMSLLTLDSHSAWYVHVTRAAQEPSLHTGSPRGLGYSSEKWMQQSALS